MSLSTDPGYDDADVVSFFEQGALFQNGLPEGPNSSAPQVRTVQSSRNTQCGSMVLELCKLKTIDRIKCIPLYRFPYSSFFNADFSFYINYAPQTMRESNFVLLVGILTVTILKKPSQYEHLAIPAALKGLHKKVL